MYNTLSKVFLFYSEESSIQKGHLPTLIHNRRREVICLALFFAPYYFIQKPNL